MTQNMKDEISFRKIYEKSIIRLAKPELGEKIIYFLELSLFLQLSLSLLTLDKTLSLSIFP